MEIVEIKCNGFCGGRLRMKQKLLVKVFRASMKIIGAKASFYLFGLSFFRRMFSNEGKSDHTFVVASCHPLDSITWHWAIYWTKPYGLKWFLSGRFGFSFHKQELLRKT